MELIEAKVRHTENNTTYTLHARADRLEAFGSMPCKTGRVPDGIPGISGMAARGLGTIFADIPPKFPVEGLLRFLAKRVWLGGVGDMLEVEGRLEQMARTYPAIDCDGDDIR